nr:hypothetical protein B0A51_14114 [Rachicladosporium sp. CCFEE 5018]
MVGPHFRNAHRVTWSAKSPTSTYLHVLYLSPSITAILSPINPMPRLSGLQKAVLALYRQCLRTARTKPEHSRPHFQSFARKEFDKNIHLDKKDFSAIEFFLRKGTRQLETYADKGVRDVVG